jgi:hypothetical protein
VTVSTPTERDITKAVVPITALSVIAGATWWLASSLHGVDSQLQSLRYELQQIRSQNEQNLRRDEFRAWVYQLQSSNAAIKVPDPR